MIESLGVAAPAKKLARQADRFRGLLLMAWVMAMPITQVIEIGSKRINLAASDLLAPFALGFLIWRAAKHRLHIPLLGLCCLSVLAIDVSILANLSSTLASKGGVAIAVEMIKILSLWLQFYVVVNLIDSATDFRNALRAWLASSVIVSLTGILGSLAFQTTGIENQYSLDFRAQGTLGDSNLFGCYLGLSILFGILLWQMDRRARKWIVPAIAVHIMGIFFSASRGTMLTVTSVLLLLIALSVSWKTRLITLGSLTAIVVGIGVMPGVQSFLASNPITERLATVTVNVNDDNASDRKVLWNDALIYFQSHPAIGIGRGNFRPLDQGDASQYGAVHNMFLGLACETGIFGASVYFLTFVCYPFAFGLDRITVGERFPLTTRVMLCAMLTLMLAGLTISLENFRGLWIVLGLMEAFRRFFGTYGIRFSKRERA